MGKKKSDYTILAVDDSDILISLIQILLEPDGYSFYSAASASEAIPLIQRHKFDLILMDIEMPEMTGLELLEELHKQDLLSETKVVMLTGKTDSESLNECLTLGVEGFILKPFDHQAMKDRVWEFLQDS